MEKSERTNAESLANNRTKIDFTFTHALVALKLDRSLGAIQEDAEGAGDDNSYKIDIGI